MLLFKTVVLALSVSLLYVRTASCAAAIVVAEGTAPLLPQQPQIAVDESGKVHLVYGVQDDTYYTQSSDGKSFSKPVKLPSVNILSLGMRRGPRIAVAKEHVCVTLIGGKQGKGRDGDVLAICSEDGGKTWLDPVAVNDVPDAAREGLHGMAAGPKGEFTCIWLDLRNKVTEVAASTSVDGGKTWSKNMLAYHSPSGSVCECCHPSITYDAKGRLVAMWRNSLNGSRDMYAAMAPKAGAPFGQAIKLGSGTWKLDRCPMDGGALAVLSDGKVSSVWRREQTIFAAINQTPEVNLGTGERPVVAATSKGSVFAWLDKRGENLMLQSSGGKAQKVAGNAYDPVLAASPSGNHVWLAWEGRQGSNGSIHCAKISPVEK